MKYFLYARKSEEDHKRQIESIPRQIKQLSERFPDCEVVDTLVEEMSAKRPGRPVFSRMVERIQAGEANGILTWSINRLLRNPVDQGTIQWLLQTKVVQSVKTMEKEYTPKDNVLILNVDAGVSNQFIKDLVEHTVAAINEKLELGWYPHRAPDGYLNDTTKPQGQRDIIVDPVRFPLIRQAWDMMLSGSCGVADVRRFLARSGYRTRPSEKRAAGAISRSALYRLFGNRFYCGYFKHNGTWYRGKHAPMVTEAEFRRVQTIMGNDDVDATGMSLSPEADVQRPFVKQERHAFTYAGLIRCGKCGCQFCGEKHYRKLASNDVNVHTYYACSNGKHICNKKSITEAKLEEQLLLRLQEVSIDPQYRELVLRVWNRYLQESVQQEELIARTLQASVAAKQKERSRLLDLLLKELIDDEQFKEKKAQLDLEIARLEERLRGGTGALDQKYRDMEEALTFMTEPREAFRKLDPADKRSVAAHLGERYFLTDGKLDVELKNGLIFAAQNAKELEADCATFERTISRCASKEKEAFEGLCSIWGGRWDAIRTVADE